MASIEHTLPEKLRLPELARRETAEAPRPRDNSRKPDATSGSRTDPEEVLTTRALADKMNTVLDVTDKSLRFSVHEATNTIVVKVVNDDSGEVLREIPQSKFLDMVAKLEKLVGFVIDQKA